ncbi:hypothetical protein BB558_005276, partial [Smittium angustum]
LHAITDVNTTDVCEVIRITNHRHDKDGKSEYLTKWRNYKEETWEPPKILIIQKILLNTGEEEPLKLGGNDVVKTTLK